MSGSRNPIYVGNIVKMYEVFDVHGLRPLTKDCYVESLILLNNALIIFFAHHRISSNNIILGSGQNRILHQQQIQLTMCEDDNEFT